MSGERVLKTGPDHCAVSSPNFYIAIKIFLGIVGTSYTVGFVQQMVDCVAARAEALDAIRKRPKS